MDFAKFIIYHCIFTNFAYIGSKWTDHLGNVRLVYSDMRDGPRLGRWLSIDPKAASFPGVSPYVSMGNNPIMMVDPRGDDAVATVEENDSEGVTSEIDDKNGTITVKAVYVVKNIYFDKSSDDIKKMENQVNNYLNNQNYILTEGEYEGYAVKFELSFIDLAEKESKGEFVSEDTYDFSGIPIGNSYWEADENSGYIHPDVKEKFTEKDLGWGKYQYCPGVVLDRKHVFMHIEKSDFRHLIHELFHTFFFDRDDAESGIGSYKTKDMPNQDDINMLINNSELPKIKIKNSETD